MMLARSSSSLLALLLFVGEGAAEDNGAVQEEGVSSPGSLEKLVLEANQVSRALLPAIDECDQPNCKFCTLGTDSTPSVCQWRGCAYGYGNTDDDRTCRACGPCADLTDGVVNGGLTPFEGCNFCTGCKFENDMCFDCNEKFGNEYVCDTCTDTSSPFTFPRCLSCGPSKGTNLKGQCKDCGIQVANKSSPKAKKRSYNCNNDPTLYVADTRRWGCCQKNCTALEEQDCKDDDNKEWCRWTQEGPFSDSETGKCNRKCGNDENIEIPPGCKANWCIAVDDQGAFSCEKCKDGYRHVRIPGPNATQGQGGGLFGKSKSNKGEDGFYGRCFPRSLPSCSGLRRPKCKAETGCRWVPPENGGPLAGTCAPKCSFYNVTTPIGCKNSGCVIDVDNDDTISCEKCDGPDYRLNRFDDYGKCQQDFL